MKFKKFLLSFLASLVLIFSIAPNFLIAKAQNAPPEGSWYNQGFNQWYNKVYDDANPSEIFGERYTAAQVQWVVYSVMAFILNGSLGNSSDSQKTVRCFLTNSGDVNTCLSALKSLLTSTNPEIFTAQKNAKKESLTSLIFAERPISGISYVREKINNFRFVPEAKAQAVGFGFSALSPVQDMWRGVRNISFGLFVFVAIVLSFMIMFRVKISPQVIISVQSAIPKMMVALILVTFSYAIAGFLIDIMYVVIGLISVAFSPMVWGLDPGYLFKFLTTGQNSPGNINIGFIGVGLIYIVLFVIFLIIFLAINLGVVGVGLAAIAIPALASIGGGLIALILPLLAIIGAIIIIWHFVRIIWELVKSFAMVLILTIFAPLQITAGVIMPNFGFNSWLKSFISSLSTFVVIGALTLFSFVFLLQGVKIGFSDIGIDIVSQIIFGNAIGGLVTPSLGSAYWPPLLGMGSSNYSVGLLFILVSFVIFTMIPKAEGVVQAFITGKQLNMSTDINELTGPIIGPMIANIQKDASSTSFNRLMRRIDERTDKPSESEKGRR